MPATRLNLGGTIANPKFGKLQSYEGIDDAGTLLAWDAEYNGAAGTAIEGNGAAVTNLTKARAQAITGLAASDCDLLVSYTDTGSNIATERTSKGAVHVASTQAGGQAVASNWGFSLSTNLAAWILANTDAGADYPFLLLQHVRLTRPQLSASGGNQPTGVLANGTSATSNYFLHTSGGIGSPAAQYNKADFNTQTAGNTGVGGLIAVASKQWSGTKPATLAARLFVAGAWLSWATNNYNKAASLAVYHAQLVIPSLANATGSTDAEKIDSIIAQHRYMVARDFALGGRFFGDTYTAPATLKP